MYCQSLMISEIHKSILIYSYLFKYTNLFWGYYSEHFIAGLQKPFHVISETEGLMTNYQLNFRRYGTTSRCLPTNSHIYVAIFTLMCTSYLFPNRFNAQEHDPYINDLETQVHTDKYIQVIGLSKASSEENIFENYMVTTMIIFANMNCHYVGCCLVCFIPIFLHNYSLRVSQALLRMKPYKPKPCVTANMAL